MMKIWRVIQPDLYERLMEIYLRECHQQDSTVSGNVSDRQVGYEQNLPQAENVATVQLEQTQTDVVANEKGNTLPKSSEQKKSSSLKSTAQSNHEVAPQLALPSSEATWTSFEKLNSTHNNAWKSRERRASITGKNIPVRRPSTNQQKKEVGLRQSAAIHQRARKGRGGARRKSKPKKRI